MAKSLLLGFEHCSGGRRPWQLMAVCLGRQGQEVQEKHHGGRRKVLDYEVREVVMAVSWRTGSVRVTGAGVGDSGKQLQSLI